MKNKLMILTMALVAVSNVVDANTALMTEHDAAVQYWSMRNASGQSPEPRVVGKPVFNDHIAQSNFLAHQNEVTKAQALLNMQPKASLALITPTAAIPEVKLASASVFTPASFAANAFKFAKNPKTVVAGLVGSGLVCAYAYSKKNKQVVQPTVENSVETVASEIIPVVENSVETVAPETNPLVENLVKTDNQPKNGLLILGDYGQQNLNKPLYSPKVSSVPNVPKSRFEGVKNAFNRAGIFVSDHKVATTGVGLAAVAGLGYLAYNKVRKAQVAKLAAQVHAAKVKAEAEAKANALKAAQAPVYKKHAKSPRRGGYRRA